ncbi:MAG TPA: glycosyltransferase family 4 protein [Candidatus Limnocylindrales bacterium]|nr:glycosyltransferase family 4 protein [Candidatus Limnocylindrales bacterium]
MTVRALMCGSVPPEWGGATMGGVATFHRTLIETFLAHPEWGISVCGVLPLNADPASPLSPPVPVVSDAGGYPDMLRAVGADVVVFQHIGHRFAAYHADLSVPAVGVVHSWHAVTQRPADASARARRALTLALPGCDTLVFVSHRTRAEGLELGFVYGAREVVIHNPVGPVFLDQADLGGPRDGWLFVGSLIERKNPLAALEAAAMRGRLLTVIGSGSLEEVLRREGGNSLVMLGPRSPAGVRQAMLRAELLCVPSTSEGFSIAYLEALACGTPVVGAGANILELSQILGQPCGAPVWSATAAETAGAAAVVESAAWDREALRASVVKAFSPESVGNAYARLLHEVRPR